MFDYFLSNYFITKYELVEPERNVTRVYFLGVYYVYLCFVQGSIRYVLELKGIEELVVNVVARMCVHVCDELLCTIAFMLNRLDV